MSRGRPLNQPSTEDTTRFRILLLIDSSDSQNELMKMRALKKGVIIDVYDNIFDSLSAIINQYYDVVITDFCDHETTTSQTIARFKQASHNTALIILIEQSDHLTEIDCLNQGADNVISKPITAPLVLARIKALNRWRYFNNNNFVKIGTLEFNKETKSLIRLNAPNIKLTEKEAQVLQFLLIHKGKIVSRVDLLHHVWGYNGSAHTHTVETHIYRLRKKLGPALGGNTIIKTEVGGYRIIA